MYLHAGVVFPPIVLAAGYPGDVSRESLVRRDSATDLKRFSGDSGNAMAKGRGVRGPVLCARREAAPCSRGKGAHERGACNTHC